MNGPQVRFFGNLTRDPQLRYTKDKLSEFSPEAGTPYVTARVAVNTYLGPNRNPDVIYYNVTLWGRHADSCNRLCKIGAQVYVEGRYSFREYTREDNTVGYSHDVQAKEFRALPSQTAIAAEPNDPDREADPDTAPGDAEDSEGAVPEAAPEDPEDED